MSAHPSRASVSERKTSSVIVIADELEMAALEPCPPPMAPTAKLFSFGRTLIMATRWVLGIFVDVRTSFSIRFVAGKTGCLTAVNDRSSLCKLGQAASTGLTAVSPSGAWRTLRERKLGNWKSSVALSAAQSFEHVVSV